MNYEIKTLFGLNKQKTALVGLPRFDFYVNGSKNDNKQIVNNKEHYIYKYIIINRINRQILVCGYLLCFRFNRGSFSFN